MKWRAAVIMLTGVCAVFVVIGYCQNSMEPDTQVDASVENSPLRSFARLAASYELAKIHSRELDTDAVMGKTWDQLFTQMLAATDVDASWKGKIIRAPVVRDNQEIPVPPDKEIDPALALSEFEKRASRLIQQGANEVLEHPTPEIVHYLRRVRVLESCLVCKRQI